MRRGWVWSYLLLLHLFTRLLRLLLPHLHLLVPDHLLQKVMEGPRQGPLLRGGRRRTWSMDWWRDRACLLRTPTGTGTRWVDLPIRSVYLRTEFGLLFFGFFLLAFLSASRCVVYLLSFFFQFFWHPGPGLNTTYPCLFNLQLITNSIFLFSVQRHNPLHSSLHLSDWLACLMSDVMTLTTHGLVSFLTIFLLLLDSSCIHVLTSIAL